MITITANNSQVALHEKVIRLDHFYFSESRLSGIATSADKICRGYFCCYFKRPNKDLMLADDSEEIQALIPQKIMKTIQKQKSMPVTVENGAIQVYIIYRFIDMYLYTCIFSSRNSTCIVCLS